MMPYRRSLSTCFNIYIYVCVCTYNLCSMLVPENDSTSTMFERYRQSLAFTNRIAYGFAARGESTEGRCLMPWRDVIHRNVLPGDAVQSMCICVGSVGAGGAY